MYRVAFSFGSYMVWGWGVVWDFGLWFRGEASPFRVHILPYWGAVQVKHFFLLGSKLPDELVECLPTLLPSPLVPSLALLVPVYFLPLVVAVGRLDSLIS